MDKTMAETSLQEQSQYPERPQKEDGQITYYGLVSPDNLVPWAVSAMKNSYVPYSNRPVGALLRTERGDITVGATVETVNYDGLSPIEIAIGRLYARQPWMDHTGEQEKISDVIFALEHVDPDDPDSYVPDGRSLEWLRKFGYKGTVVHFADAETGKIKATHKLQELLPFCAQLKDIGAYHDNTVAFRDYLSTQQEKPETLSHEDWHALRKSRLFAFAPSSTYRVSVIVEPASPALTQELRAELLENFRKANMDETQQKAVLDMISKDRERFNGINVELSNNDALHAEGCAIGAMITDLGPESMIKKLTLQGGMNDTEGECTPCGKCRALVSEFSNADTKVVFTTQKDGVLNTVREETLLPHAFRLHPGK